MKPFDKMTRAELVEEMKLLFPYLFEPMPYQPRIKTKEERESEYQHRHWYADMQDAVNHHADIKRMGER